MRLTACVKLHKICILLHPFARPQVFARAQPEDKLEIVKSLQGQGKVAVWIDFLVRIREGDEPKSRRAILDSYSLIYIIISFNTERPRTTRRFPVGLKGKGRNMENIWFVEKIRENNDHLVPRPFTSNNNKIFKNIMFCFLCDP